MSEKIYKLGYSYYVKYLNITKYGHGDIATHSNKVVLLDYVREYFKNNFEYPFTLDVDILSIPKSIRDRELASINYNLTNAVQHRIGSFYIQDITPIESPEYTEFNEWLKNR